MSILVFGAGGQLGSELVGLAHSKDIAFHFARRADAYIDDPAAVRRAMQLAHPSLVLNAAAYTNVDQAEVERDEAFRANGEGPKVLAQACAEKNIPLIHISTDYVFDGSKPGAYVEDDATGPIGVYGQSKLAGEIAVANAIPHHVILRTSWVFGIYGRNFLKTMLKLAGERDELKVVADQRGCPTSTADLADAIVTIAPRLIAGEAVFGLYHFASPQPTTWHGFASEIVDAQAAFTGRRPAVLPIETKDYVTKATRPQNSELDSSKVFSTFGFRAKDWRERTQEAVAALCGQAKAEIA